MKEHISGKLLRLWSIKTIRTVSKFVWQLGRYKASSPSTKELNGHTMELFSRNRWTTGSAQESIGYVKLQSICHNHNSIPLGPIEPSSSSAKELHGGSYLPNGKLLCLCHNNRDNTGMAIIKFVKQLNKYKPSSSSAKELYELSKTSRLRITHGIQTHIL